MHCGSIHCSKHGVPSQLESQQTFSAEQFLSPEQGSVHCSGQLLSKTHSSQDGKQASGVATGDEWSAAEFFEAW